MAADPEVKVFSFEMAGPQTASAEICGTVTGVAAPFAVVQVSVDPTAKVPGIYNTMVGMDGNFCLAVVTFRGMATVKLIMNAGAVVKDRKEVSATISANTLPSVR